MDNYQKLLDTIAKVSPLNHELWREIMKELRIYSDYVWGKVINTYKKEE